MSQIILNCVWSNLSFLCINSQYIDLYVHTKYKFNQDEFSLTGFFEKIFLNNNLLSAETDQNKN
jgi:hypothetical protein